MFVIVWVATVSAQTGFGVQRFSNVQRSPLSAPALSSASSYPLRPSESETPPSFTTTPSGGENRRKLQTPPIAGVVRLIAFEKSGQSFGSGSYIGNSGEYGLILSNWHVVKDCDGLVHVHFPNGFSSFGAVIDSDEKWDLATIVISKPPSSVASIPVARTFPVLGEPLWIAGHGSGVYRLAGGRCVRYLAPEMPTNGTNPIYEIIELSVSARQGDSGGPILNRNGELAGVLFGSDMVQNTAGSYCGRVSQFLLRATPILHRLPAQPEVYFASIEKEGPKRQLRETVNFVPADAVASVAAPSVVDIAGSSSSSFGVRSNSRRYVQNGQPAAISVTDKAPSPPKTPAVPSPPPSPTLPDAPSPTGPIQKAIWTSSNLYGNATPSPPQAPVVQTGLNTEVIPGGPFAEDHSGLNPGNESASSYRVIRENLKKADYTQKYTGVSRSPYTLPTIRPEPQKSWISSTFLPGGFLLIGLLVLQAIRLIRNDADTDENEEELTELATVPQHRKRVA